MYGEPLNPRLYQALGRRFGDVKIAKQGEETCCERRPSMYRAGKWESPPLWSGEYYLANCPHCGDTRQRLWVNHLFGVVDRETRDDHLYLVTCFNEGCINTRELQERLYELLFPFNYNAKVRICELSTAANNTKPPPATTVPATLPEPLWPLTDPACQQARDYLLSRGFDPMELAAHRHVSFCFRSQTSQFPFNNRLIIPVYTLTPILDGNPVPTLVGWQARSLNDLGLDGPKYLTMTGMRKSQVLYGLIEAKKSTGAVIVVEGVTDAWRLGSNAVATLGKSISPAQIQLLLRHFVGRPLGVMYDSDARIESRLTADRIREERRKWSDYSPVVDVPVPAGRKDAGECSQAELWDAIRSAFSGSPRAGEIIPPERVSAP